jgi:hypothetical protein
VVNLLFITITLVKNLFGLSLLDVFLHGVIYMSYIQALTPIHNSQLLLKMPILNKFRLAMFHKSATQRNYSIKTCINQFRRNESSRDREINCTVRRRVSLKCEPFLQCHLSFGIFAGRVKQCHYHISLI